MSDNISYVAKMRKYKETSTDEDRIFEAMWRKTGKYGYFGLNREQMIQIEKEGYIMPAEIRGNDFEN